MAGVLKSADAICQLLQTVASDILQCLATNGFLVVCGSHGYYMFLPGVYLSLRTEILN